MSGDKQQVFKAEKKEELFGKNIYKALYDSSPEAIVLLDRKGKVLMVNERLSDWLGYSSEEIVGKNILQLPFIPSEEMILATGNMTKRFLGTNIEPYELEFTAKDGKKKFGRVIGRLVSDDSGKVIGDMIMISDISEQKDLSILARERQNLLKQYLTVIDDIIVLLDKNGEVMFVNDEACKILGYPKNEIVGKNWFERFISPEDKERLIDIHTINIKQDKDKDSVDFVKNEVIDKQGAKKMISWHNSVLRDVDGVVYASISSGRDITEEENEKIQKEKKHKELERMNELMLGRELRMAELKMEIKRLKEKGG